MIIKINYVDWQDWYQNTQITNTKMPHIGFDLIIGGPLISLYVLSVFLPFPVLVYSQHTVSLFSVNFIVSFQYPNQWIKIRPHLFKVRLKMLRKNQMPGLFYNT